MQISWSCISCGAYALHGLSLDTFKAFLIRPEAAAKEAGLKLYGHTESWKHPRQGFKEGFKYLFSDVIYDGFESQGTRIARYIEAKGLGALHEVGKHKNPNTGNDINIWVWTYNGKIPKELQVPEKPIPQPKVTIRHF